LISSNPFDVIGAVSAGMRAAWLQRTPDAVFDPWEIEPSITVDNLYDLGERILQYKGPD
jgi:2-haloacid dehalogenase